MSESPCVYPDWEDGYEIGKHVWQKGWCCICGEKKSEGMK